MPFPIPTVLDQQVQQAIDAIARYLSGFDNRVETIEKSGAPASGVAGGDLTGEYPDPDIKANAVGSAEIAENAVGSSEIAEGAVGTSELASEAVETADIKNGAVTAAKVAAAGELPRTTARTGTSTGTRTGTAVRCRRDRDLDLIAFVQPGCDLGAPAG